MDADLLYDLNAQSTCTRHVRMSAARSQSGLIVPLARLLVRVEAVQQAGRRRRVRRRGVTTPDAQNPERYERRPCQV